MKNDHPFENISECETQIFLIRHAEKDTIDSDPALTEKGLERAEKLAYFLKDAGIEYIHSSNFIRTKQTVEPLANQLMLPIELYDHKELDNLKSTIIAKKGVHLVSGHSNSTPALVSLLGGDPGAPIDEKTEFDRLYILTISRDKLCRTTLLRYGDQ